MIPSPASFRPGDDVIDDPLEMDEVGEWDGDPGDEDSDGELGGLCERFAFFSRFSWDDRFRVLWRFGD